MKHLAYLWFEPDFDDQPDFLLLWVSEMRPRICRSDLLPYDSILDIR